MISAVNTLTFISFAMSAPSFVRLTSNARIVAYSGLCSSMIDALITSFLWIARCDGGHRDLARLQELEQRLRAEGRRHRVHADAAVHLGRRLRQLRQVAHHVLLQHLEVVRHVGVRHAARCRRRRPRGGWRRS